MCTIQEIFIESTESSAGHGVRSHRPSGREMLLSKPEQSNSTGQWKEIILNMNTRLHIVNVWVSGHTEERGAFVTSV